MDSVPLPHLKYQGLNYELHMIKEDAFVKFKVPSVYTLAEMELVRLNETMLNMTPKEAHIDDGLLLIKSIANVFRLRGSASVEVFKNRVVYELKVIQFCSHPPLPHLSNFVSYVINELERLFQIELFAEKARGFSLVDSSPRPPRPDARVPCKNLEMWVDFAVEVKMDANPESIHVLGNQVMEVLKRISRMVVINVDDDDVKRLIIQKCNEAIEFRNKKVAEDQTKSVSSTNSPS